MLSLFFFRGLLWRLVGRLFPVYSLEFKDDLGRHSERKIVWFESLLASRVRTKILHYLWSVSPVLKYFTASQEPARERWGRKVIHLDVRNDLKKIACVITGGNRYFGHAGGQSLPEEGWVMDTYIEVYYHPKSRCYVVFEVTQSPYLHGASESVHIEWNPRELQNKFHLGKDWGQNSELVEFLSRI